MKVLLAEELQKKIIGVLLELKPNFDVLTNEYSGDSLFWKIVKKCFPKDEIFFHLSVLQFWLNILKVVIFLKNL